MQASVCYTYKPLFFLTSKKDHNWFKCILKGHNGFKYFLKDQKYFPSLHLQRDIHEVSNEDTVQKIGMLPQKAFELIVKCYFKKHFNPLWKNLWHLNRVGLYKCAFLGKSQFFNNKKGEGVKGVVACVTKHVPIPKIMCHVSMTGSSNYSGRFGQHLAGLGRVGHSSPPLLYFSPSYGGCILPP